MNIRNLMAGLLLWSITCKLSANITQDMNRFLNSGGIAVNITGASAFKGQAAGGFTLGSMSLRNSQRSFTPIMMQAPGLRMGCGGIDAFTGAFSFIRSKELMRAFRSIGNGMPVYAAMIALDSSSPVAKKTMDFLHRIESETNRFNINSCETAAGIVGGLWPRTDAAKRHVCTTAAGPGGIFSDFAAAKQGCNTPEGSKNVFDKISALKAKKQSGQTLSKKEEELLAFDNMVANKGNIAWKILEKTNFVKEQGVSMAEVVMSLSGTFILDEESNGWVYWPSKASDILLLQALLYGEIQAGQEWNDQHTSSKTVLLKPRIYTCGKDTQECLHPTEGFLEFQKEAALVPRIRKVLHRIQNKAILDEPLTASEKNLIEVSLLPLFKAINVQSAVSIAKDVINLEEYADILALDLLEEYLNDLLNVVKNGAHVISSHETTMQRFHEGLIEARRSIAEFRSKTRQKRAQANDLVPRLQLLEQQVVGEFDADMLRTIDYIVARR